MENFPHTDCIVMHSIVAFEYYFGEGTKIHSA